MVRRIIFIGSMTTIVAAIIFLIVYIVAALRPSEAYFKYYSLSNASAQGEIIMASDVEKIRLGDLHYNDVLMCKQGGRYVYFSSFLSESTYKKQSRTENLWVYGGKLPRFKTECYMRSVITLKVEFGHQKKVVIESLPFQYIPYE